MGFFIHSSKRLLQVNPNLWSLHLYSKRTMSLSSSVQNLVSTEWLADHLKQVTVIDGSWHMPNTKRIGSEEYQKMHIPGARFFDIDKIADQSTTLPHMLPSSEDFEYHVGNMGISNKDHIVIYDTWGIGPSCRVYWTFRIFGHAKVSVLDGGLPKWIKENRPIEHGNVSIQPTKYTANFNRSMVRSFQEMVENVNSSQGAQVIDARSSDRFHGLAPEPRPGLPSGHIPHSISIPFQTLIETSTGTFKSPQELKSLFELKGLNLNQSIITSCGSGVTAAILFLGIERARMVSTDKSSSLDSYELALYDGSWADWGAKGEISEKGPR